MNRTPNRTLASRLFLALTAALVLAPAARAQAVVGPEKPLDATRAKVRGSLVVLRDSLLAVSVAAARLQRDYERTSTAALESRAQALQQACASAERALPATRAAIAGLASSNKGQKQSQRVTLKALDQLKPELSKCAQQFGEMSAKGEEVRGYGVRRSEPVVKAVQEYDARSVEFAQSHDIPFRPVGVGRGVLAS